MDRITHDDQRAFKRPDPSPAHRARTRVHAVLWSMIRERVGVEGGRWKETVT